MEKMENQDRRGFRVNFDALCLGDDLDVSEEHSSTEDRFFDSVIGHIEDVLLEDEFQNQQKCFLERYWQEFDYGEENKLSYMDIFKEYFPHSVEKFNKSFLNQCSAQSMLYPILNNFPLETVKERKNCHINLILFTWVIINLNLIHLHSFRFRAAKQIAKINHMGKSGVNHPSNINTVKGFYLGTLKALQIYSCLIVFRERKDELDGEVFEILDTFSDFMAFKEMFLDYKAIKEGTVEDLSKDIVVSSKH
ncbi:ADP-ribosylation factor-like protein 2-binding protein [Gryllus bimaculatus]|nr:ADP-ribosylation factor-like protein 2-binding protein [Gryllus bimaculatus]